MASLANQTISSTYDGLIKTATDQPVGISGVQLLEDGVGNSLALSVGRANQGVTITGTLTATSISGVLANGVTATTQSAGDNSTKVATTAYVDSIVTAQDLDFAGDSGTGAVDLDSQSLTIAGTANEIETSASGQTITIGLPSSVTVGTLTATNLGGTLSTSAQPNITSVGTLSSLAVSGNLTVDTDTLYVDAANNRVGIGTSSPKAKVHSDSSIFAGGAGDGTEVNGTNIYQSVAVGAGISRGVRLQVTSDSGYAGLRLDGMNGTFSTSALPSTGTYDRTLLSISGLTGDISFPNGAGINFGASAGGGATSSLLDDYEEGTWTPGLTGFDTLGTLTYTVQAGYYTKIGNTVHLRFRIVLSGYSGNSGTNIAIDGLPYTPGSDSNLIATNAIFAENVTYSGELYGWINPGTALIYIASIASGGTFTHVSSGNYSASTTINGIITYKV